MSGARRLAILVLCCETRVRLRAACMVPWIACRARLPSCSRGCKLSGFTSTKRLEVHTVHQSTSSSPSRPLAIWKCCNSRCSVVGDCSVDCGGLRRLTLTAKSHAAWHPAFNGVRLAGWSLYTLTSNPKLSQVIGKSTLDRCRRLRLQSPVLWDTSLRCLMRKSQGCPLVDRAADRLPR